MSWRRWLTCYATAAAVFLALDLVWLTVVATPLYDALLGELLAPRPNGLAAAAFYALFLAGLVHFVVGPALGAAPAAPAARVRRAARDGAFFGLVTYATWDLTSLAVIAGFPALLVPVDLAWGAVLAAAVAAATVALDARRASRHRARPGTTSAPGS